jgi:hypothetical protein
MAEGKALLAGAAAIAVFLIAAIVLGAGGLFVTVRRAGLTRGWRQGQIVVRPARAIDRGATQEIFDALWRRIVVQHASQHTEVSDE